MQSVPPQPELQTHVSGDPQYPPLKHPRVHCAIWRNGIVNVDLSHSMYVATTL